MSDQPQAMQPMPAYLSHKKVWALKIARVESKGTDTTTEENPIVEVHFVDSTFAPRTFNLRGKPTPEAGWYMVQYRDGYISFSPEKAFEEGHTRLTAENNPDGAWHGIGWAVKQMQTGLRVRRRGWNGPGQWISVIPGDQWGIGSGAQAFDNWGPGDILPFVAIHTAQGKIIPWLVSQSDLLAIDWEIAP